MAARTKPAPPPSSCGRLYLPVDFMAPVRRTDLMILALLCAREKPRDPAQKQLRERMWAAFQSTMRPRELLLFVLYLADADPLVLSADGHSRAKSRAAANIVPSTNSETRLALARAAVMHHLSIDVGDEILREAMWPARGQANVARAALAKRLGWPVTPASLSAMLPSLKSGKPRRGRAAHDDYALVDDAEWIEDKPASSHPRNRPRRN
jgi:hypothetical protein